MKFTAPELEIMHFSAEEILTESTTESGPVLCDAETPLDES